MQDCVRPRSLKELLRKSLSEEIEKKRRFVVSTVVVDWLCIDRANVYLLYKTFLNTHSSQHLSADQPLSNHTSHVSCALMIMSFLTSCEKHNCL